MPRPPRNRSPRRPPPPAWDRKRPATTVETIAKDDVGTMPAEVVAGGAPPLNIQAGHGTVVRARGASASGKKRAAFLQAAMVWAITECHKRGITDPDVIREAQLKAHDMAKLELDQ